MIRVVIAVGSRPHDISKLFNPFSITVILNKKYTFYHVASQQSKQEKP
jgi:hypothetical protein